MDKYLINSDGLKYVKDKIQNKLLLVENVVEVNFLPSNGEGNTLYILADTTFYSNNSVFYQVELEEQPRKNTPKVFEGIKK